MTFSSSIPTLPKQAAYGSQSVATTYRTLPQRLLLESPWRRLAGTNMYLDRPVCATYYILLLAMWIHEVGPLSLCRSVALSSSGNRFYVAQEDQDPR